ncbi:hypothetical protein [Sulfitobacter sp. 1A15299]|uniref:hypothetical protein n=1 Tax=Sulfitobacter sp. 1A15299 TaxID=3368598 RepID=UPI00374676C9
MYKAIYILQIFFLFVPALVQFLSGMVLSGVMMALSFLAFSIPMFLHINTASVFSDRERRLYPAGLNYTLSVLVAFYILGKIDAISGILTALGNGNIQVFLRQNAVIRYEDFDSVSTLTIAQRLAVVSFFAYSYLLPFSKKHGIIKAVVLVLMWLVEMSSLARTGVFLSIVALSTSAMWQFNFKLNNISLLRMLFYFNGAAIVLSIFFIGGVILRMSSPELILSHPEILYLKVLQYTFAMYAAFEIWLVDSDTFTFTGGVYTFASLFKIFGLRFDQGLYDGVSTVFGFTNIYTVLRGLIADFSIFGAVIFYLLSSLCFARWSRRKTKASLVGFSILCPIFIYPFMSPHLFFNFSVGIAFGCLLARSSLRIGPQRIVESSP